MAPASVSLAWKRGVGRRKQALLSQSSSWRYRGRSCGFYHRVWGRVQGPSQHQEQKPSTCFVCLGLVGHGDIFPFTLYCPLASITFLTQSPGMRKTGTPEILGAVTHSKVCSLPASLSTPCTAGLPGRSCHRHSHIAGPGPLNLRTGIKVGLTGLCTECVSKSRGSKRIRKRDRI